MGTSGTVLTEQAVRKINKDVLSKLSKDLNPDVSAVGAILRDILRTTEEVRLENAHRAAACDALRGLLWNGAASADSGLRELCTSSVTWRRALAMYFDRNNDARARPMKQVLETLVRVLQEMHHHNATRSRECLHHAVALCVGYLLDQANAGLARPALFLLDNLLSKKMIKSASLIEIAADMTPKQYATSSFSKSELFVYHILLWARNPDIAPVCGRFIISLCHGMRSHAKTEPPTSAEEPSIVWLKPVRELLNCYPGLIAVLEHEVIPGLLRSEPDAGMALFHDLPFIDLIQETTRTVKEADIRLSLILLRINDEIGISGFDDKLKCMSSRCNASMMAESAFSPREQICANMLRHRSPDVRLAALSILIAPNLTAHPLNIDTITILQDRIWGFLDESDARVRNDFLSLMKRLFGKIEALAHRLSKLDSGQSTIGGRHTGKVWLIDELPDIKAKLTANVAFIATYQSRLREHLTPTASYQHHILALRTLAFIRNLGLPEPIVQTFPNVRPERWLARSLLDLTMDPFEDVRSMAATILLTLNLDSRLLPGVLNNAEALMRSSGRADHADGFGRIVDLSLRANRSTDDPNNEIISYYKLYKQGTNQVIDEVDQLVDFAKIDLERAVADAPLHGKTIALRYLLMSPDTSVFLSESLSETMARGASIEPSSPTNAKDSEPIHPALRIVSICEKIWELVYPILCDDSPEGNNFLAEDEESGPDIGIKDTLSYAWRALKEGSLLLRGLLCAMPKPVISTKGLMARIGKLLFTQLTQLRHRGAFSAVAQTHASFCATCISWPGTVDSSLLYGLYKDTLACIQAKSTALTRRSAGLPALTVGLLCAKPTGEMTSQAMSDLKRIAQEPVGTGVTSELPQVHALNCLKDIFTSTKLASAVEPHLSSVLTIAVDCLDKDLWAIRNSGLMLLKAVLLRLEEGRVNSNPEYQKLQRGRYLESAYAVHPALADIVLGLLRGASSISVASDDLFGTNEVGSFEQQERLIEKTFPAIEVIERIGFPPASIGQVKNLLFNQLGSPVWAMRNKTAGCLALLLTPDEVVGRCQAIAEGPHAGAEVDLSNTLHGNMLLVRHAIREGRFESREAFLAGILISRAATYSTQRPDAVVEELFHENIGTLLQSCRSPSLSQIYSAILRISSGELGNELSKRSQQSARLCSNQELASYNLTRAICLVETKVSVVSILEHSLSLGDRSFLGALTALQESQNTPKAEEMTILIQLASLNVAVLPPPVVRATMSYFTATILHCLKSSDRVTKREVATSLLSLVEQTIGYPGTADLLHVLIELWGQVVAFIWISTEGVRDRTVLEPWCNLIRTAFEDQADFVIREAAVNSVLGFREVFVSLKSGPPSNVDMLSVSLVIYDGLIDDDEDIRLISAQCASWILSAGAHDNGEAALSPAAARQDIFSMLGDHVHSAPSLLVQQAFTRVFGDQVKNVVATPFADRLRRLEEISTTLFAEERQNQYVDQLQEATTWSRILQMSDAGFDLVDAAVLTWTRDGLQTLQMRLIEDDMSAFQGPAGISARYEIFLLIARLLLIAGFVSYTAARVPEIAGNEVYQQLSSILIKVVKDLESTKQPVGLSEDLCNLLKVV